MITFRGIKPGPVAFLGFLILTSYLTIEKTQHKTKEAPKGLIGESKGAQERKAHKDVRRMAHSGEVMMGEARRRVRCISMTYY